MSPALPRIILLPPTPDAQSANPPYSTTFHSLPFSIPLTLPSSFSYSLGNIFPLFLFSCDLPVYTYTIFSQKSHINTSGSDHFRIRGVQKRRIDRDLREENHRREKKQCSGAAHK
jgi:hypothetical protein